MNKKLISTLLSLAMVVATLPMTMLTASATVDEAVVSRGKPVVVVGAEANSASYGPNIVNGLREKGGMYDWMFAPGTSGKFGYIDLGRTQTITKIITIRRSSPEGCGNLSYYVSDNLLSEEPTADTEGVTLVGTLADNVCGTKSSPEAGAITPSSPVSGRYVYFDSDASEGIYEIEVYAVPDTEPQDLLFGKTGTKSDGSSVTVYTDHTAQGIGTNVGSGNWVRYDLGFEADLRYLYCHATSYIYHRPGFGVKAGNTTDFDSATVLLEPSPDRNEERTCGSRIEISGKYRYIWLYSTMDNCYLDDVRIYGVDDRQYVLGDWSFTEANGEYIASIDVEYINSTSLEFTVQMINYDENGNMVGNPTENVIFRTDGADEETMTGTIPSSLMVDHTQVVLMDETGLVSMYNENHGGTWDGFNDAKGTADNFEDSVSMATSAEYPFEDVSVTISGKSVKADDLIMISAFVDTGAATYASEEIDDYYYMAYAVANNGYEFNIPLTVAGDYTFTVTRTPSDPEEIPDSKTFTYTLIEPEEIKDAINSFFPESEDEADYGAAIDNAIETVGIIGEVDIIDRDIIYNTDFAVVAIPIGEKFKTVDDDGNVALNTDELIDAVNTMIVVYKLRDGDASVMEEFGSYITGNADVLEWVDANLQYSLDADVVPQDNLTDLTNIGEVGAVKFTFTEAMNPASLTSENIVLKKGEDFVPYDVAKATEDEFWIDLGSLDAGSSYSVIFTDEIKNLDGKKMLGERTFEFTTGEIAKVPYQDGKILKNIVLNKDVINLSEVQTLGGDGATADMLFDGSDSAFASFNSLKSASPIVDLEGYYSPAAIRLTGRSTQWYYHFEDIEFIGVGYERGVDVPTSADIAAGKGVMFHKIEKVTTSGNLYADAILHHGNIVSIRETDALMKYGPIRYLAIKANQDVYIREIEVFAYVDVEFGDITVNNATVQSGSSHTFSTSITENVATGNTWYMILNAYDANGHTVAKTVRQIAAANSSAQITATADTVGITAMIVDDLDTMNQVIAPLTIGTPMQSQAALGTGVQIKGSTSQIQMSANAGTDVTELSNVSMIVIKESVTDGSSAANVFASLTQLQLESGLVFANAQTVKNGATFAISGLDTGKYYIQVVASNPDGSKRAVAQYKQAIVDDNTRDEIVEGIMSAEGDALSDALVDAIYDDEIISIDAMDDGANLRAKLESENLDSELGYTRFVELLGYTKDMLYPDGAQNAGAQDVIDLVNATQTAYALDQENTEKAVSMLATYGTLLGDSYIPDADKTKLANIFENVNDDIDSSTSLAEAIKWSGLLAFMDGASDTDVAEALQTYANEYGIDLSYASNRGVSLTRVANFIPRNDLMLLYGKDAFNSAYKKAVEDAGENKGEVPNTKPSDNIQGGVDFVETGRPQGGNGGGNGGGGGASAPKPVATPKPVASGFADMQGYAWADEAVAALVKAGVIDGNENGEFEPARSVTRAEFVKMLVVASKIKVDEAEGMHFIDVPNNSWQYPYVKIAYSRKICKGVDDYYFNPDGTITRQDMAVMLSNMLTYLGVDAEGSEKSFTDSSNVADYATSAVTTASKAGLINGFDDGSFRPRDNTRRVDAAMVISKLLNIIG